ncbi:unnamed protein product [Lactuca saligna]|uniref:BCAS3 domain-containing protein n=1 Tax=Lactuca saligna TaxID=75948 RepID=A0AA35Z0P7_LACSI|nr:unnamed protein product [Lactuca saligna]CAI9283561.1 unnamed protein product [Lactuca saligna]
MTKNSSVKARSNAVIDEGKSNDVAVLTIVVIGGIDGDGDAVRVKEVFSFFHKFLQFNLLSLSQLLYDSSIFFVSLSIYIHIFRLRSTVASTVRSTASAASTIVDRDNDVVPDQVPWVEFDKLECEGDISHKVLLLGYQFGFQVWDVEDANNMSPSLRVEIFRVMFRSVVYSVRCGSRIVVVLQSAQVHCFDVATLQREYTIITNQIETTPSRFEKIGLGPVAVGPKWIAYSGSIVALPNTRVNPQHLTHSKKISAPGLNGSIVAHYAKLSSKQLAVEIVTLCDIGYKNISSYYSDFLPDGNISQQLNARKDRVASNGYLPDAENVGMVIARDVFSKSVIAQFKAHDSPITSLSVDPSGTLLVIQDIKSGLSPNSGPQALSAVSRIRNGNGGWKNVVTGAAVAESGRVNNSYSGVIASTFYKCKGNSNNTVMSGLDNAYEYCSDHDSRLMIAGGYFRKESKTKIVIISKIYFQSLKMDDVIMEEENNSKGEFEIEKIITHTVEARPRHLVPAVDHFRGPIVQTTRVLSLDYISGGVTLKSLFRMVVILCT